MSFKKWWHDEIPHIRLLAIGLLAFNVWGCYTHFPQTPVMVAVFGTMAVFIAVGLYLYW